MRNLELTQDFMPICVDMANLFLRCGNPTVFAAAIHNCGLIQARRAPVKGVPEDIQHRAAGVVNGTDYLEWLDIPEATQAVGMAWSEIMEPVKWVDLSAAISIFMAFCAAGIHPVLAKRCVECVVPQAVQTPEVLQ